MKPTDPSAATTAKGSSAKDSSDRDSSAEGSCADAEWQQLEDFVAGLHDAARSATNPAEFYDRLLQGTVTLLAAVGGAVWRCAARGELELLCQTNLDAVLDRDDVESRVTHHRLLRASARLAASAVYPPQSSGASAGANPTSSVLLVCPVVGADAASDAGLQDDAQAGAARTLAVVELFQRSGSSPATQQGWQQFLTTVCLAAADFHNFYELRTLRAEQRLRHRSAELLRRVHSSLGLKQTAFEVANEGRRMIDCDRVCVLLRRGDTWRLLAVSGVDRTEPRADMSRRMRELAERTAHWGEPICYAENDENGAADHAMDHLPTELSELFSRHVDESHARQLVAVPLQFKRATAAGEKLPKPGRSPDAVLPDAVIVAEQFDAARTTLSRQRVVELAELCEPALRQAERLDRLPVRAGMRLAQWASWLSTRLGLRRSALALGGVLAVIGALVLVPCDFEVSAPAKLVPLVERDVFASCDGTVAEVRAAHGDAVARGDVLAVLHDPQLALESQRVHGEIQTVLKQLEAVTAARTDRSVREETADSALPLSAKQQQLTQRLASLRAQQQILQQRRDALTLRSPIAGQVLTLDVQNLLRTRPVERGQVLFTVADLQSGWRLEADLPQDRLGHVVRAQQTGQVDLPVRFRLADNLAETFPGHVEQISTRAVLSADDLSTDAPPMRVNIRVDQSPLTGRPGMTAEVRIACGRRSLGYVWLHDVWEKVYAWFAF